MLPTRLPTSLPTPALPTPEPLLECRTNSLGMRFCRIRDDLWIASHELTQAQYDALLEHRPSTFTGEDHPVEGLALVDAQDAADELTSREAGTEHLLPGWRYRVPTEAQWEDAARAAPASEGVARTERAWFRANSETDDPGGYPCADWVTPPQPGRRCSTHPVGAKQGDALGLHDMLGNVWEWTTTAEAPGSELRVLKGGAWTSSLDQLDPGTRHPFDPGFGAHDHGVRFVLVPE